MKTAKKKSSRRSPRPTPAKTARTRSAKLDNWRQEYAARIARIAETLELHDLGESERAFLATCQKINRRFTGCNSPFEEFFQYLVLSVERGRWPTPEDVSRELDTFREHFDDMRKDAEWFVKTYPAATSIRASDVGSASLPPQETEVNRRDLGWEEQTPQITYELSCFSPSDLEQKIELTREDFIFLKRALAQRRGVAVSDMIERG